MMKVGQLRICSLLLALLVAATGCAAQTGGPQESAPPPPVEAPGLPAVPEALLKSGWPHDLAPAELPEYKSGKVTASTVDGDGVLIIRVMETSKSDLHAYVDLLQQAGWIVTSRDTEAEAVLGLYTVRLNLQGDGSALQINLYTEEAGSWPSDQIPSDILEPQTGSLVGTVEISQTGETMWYFDYTYDGVDAAAAEEYMNLLLQNGWRGDIFQAYKNFEWKDASYEASVEIYATEDTRTTFTCNFYLTDAEPAAESAAAPAGDADASVVGSWGLGMLSGGRFNAASGRYEGGATGMGQVYTFRPDNTFTALVVWSTVMQFTGRYETADGVLTLTGRTVEESADDGKTWSAPETLPDASSPFIAGIDETGAYLLLGEEGATPPLVEKQNAMKYKRQD